MSNFILNNKNQLVQVQTINNDELLNSMVERKKIEKLYSFGEDVSIYRYIEDTKLKLFPNVGFKLGICVQEDRILFSLFQITRLYRDNYIKLFSGILLVDNNVKKKIDDKIKYKRRRKYYKRLNKKRKLARKGIEIKIKKPKIKKNTKEKLLSDYYFGLCQSILHNICKFIPKDKLMICFYYNKRSITIYKRLKKIHNYVTKVTKVAIKLIKRRIRYRKMEIKIKSDIMIFGDNDHFLKNLYTDDWQIPNEKILLFQKTQRHINRRTHKYRDRNYYFKNDPKKRIVAKNRHKRYGQIERSFHELFEKIQEHIKKIKQFCSPTELKEKIKQFQLVVKPGKKTRRKSPNELPFHQGDIIQYQNNRYICKYYDSGGKKLKLLGFHKKVKQSECTLIRRNPGLICLNNFICLPSY